MKQKPKYIIMSIQTKGEIQGLRIDLCAGESLGMCPVYSSKAKARHDFPDKKIQLVEIEMVKKDVLS